MTTYATGTIASLIFAFMYKNTYKNKERYLRKGAHYTNLLLKCYALLSFLPLAIISAFRYYVGTDFASYSNIYKTREAVNYMDLGEPLFSLFIQLLNKISRDPQFFFVISSFIIVGSYFAAIYKNSENITMSILLYVLTEEYFRAMNVTRQYIALAILLFSIQFIKKRNWKCAFILLFVAYLIHNSAVAFLPLVLLSVFSIKIEIMLICLIILFLSLDPFMSVVFPLIQRFTHFYGYFYSREWGESLFSRRLFVVYIVYMLFILYLYFIEKAEFSGEMKLLANAVFVGAFLSFASTILPANARRMVWYMDSIIVIFTPSMLGCVKNKSLSKIIGYVIVITYGVIAVTSVIHGNNGVLPYQTFMR